MTPFRKIPASPMKDMCNREVLLSQSDDFFVQLFEGRAPTLPEKLQFVEEAVQRLSSMDIWENDTYRVEVASRPPFIHLNISRHDDAPCTNWRDFQRIKNELVGSEHEAIELFPAESRKVDAANQYHLWVMADPDFRFPLGFAHRFVLDQPVRPQPGLHNKVDGVSRQASPAGAAAEPLVAAPGTFTLVWRQPEVHPAAQT